MSAVAVDPSVWRANKNRQRLKTSLERFTEKYVINDLTGCWEWQARIKRGGYGQFWLGKPMPAHRAAYLLLVAPIPEGMSIDHLCGVKRCVNPTHMEIVTSEENSSRYWAQRTHCKHGHPLTAENVRVYRGVRLCRPCRARVARDQRSRLKRIAA